MGTMETQCNNGDMMQQWRHDAAMETHDAAMDAAMVAHGGIMET